MRDSNGKSAYTIYHYVSFISPSRIVESIYRSFYESHKGLL